VALSLDRRRFLKYAIVAAVGSVLVAIPGYELYRRWQITAQTVTIEGRYVDLIGPPPYANMELVGKLDTAYELLLDLTGVRPYDGAKIGVLLDSVDSSEYQALAGNPITVVRHCWQELHQQGNCCSELYHTGYHELSHDFMGIPEFDRIIFVTDEFVEGFRALGQQYVYYHVDRPTYEEWRSAYRWPLEEYSKNQFLFEYRFDRDVCASMLMDLVDRYGFDMWKRFFRNIYKLDIGPKEDRTMEERCSLFVRCVSEAAGEDLTDYFKNLRFPIGPTG